MPGRGCPCGQPPVKTLGTKSPVGVPGRQHFARVVTTHCWGGSARPCDSTREDTGSWRLVSRHRRVHLFPLQVLLGSSLCNKSNPQGHFSGTTPQMQGMRTLTPANINREELLRRLGLAGRRGGKVDTQILESTGTRPAPGSGSRGSAFIYLAHQLFSCPCWSVPSSNSQGATKTGFSGIGFVLILNILCSTLKRLNKE